MLNSLHTRIATLVLVAAAFLLLSAAATGPASSGAAAADNVAPSGPRAKASAVPPQQQFGEGTAEFQAALGVATAHWGGLPCSGTVAIEWAPLEPLTNARASWHNPTDAYNNAAQNFNCRVVFNSTGSFDFPAFCTVLTHEYGHLFGQAHDPNEGQLMSAIYTTPLPACVAADPASAAAAAAKAQADAAAAAAALARPTTTPESSAVSRRAAKAAAAKQAAAKKAKARKAAAKRKALERKAKTRKRCFTRLSAGKRVKRCTPVRSATKRAAKKL